MKDTLVIIQTISGIALSSLVLLQAKGIGLARSITGGGYHSKRGMEVVVFRMTIILAVVFVVLSIVSQLIV